MDDAEVVEAIMDLTDSLFAEYMKRYGNWAWFQWSISLSVWMRMEIGSNSIIMRG
jgi:hypothetical protein